MHDEKKSRADLLIPKKLHFVWLGNVLSDKGQQNLVAWKKTNPNYEVNLWIDSSLYPKRPKEPKFKANSEDVLQWKEYIKKMEQYYLQNESIRAKPSLPKFNSNDKNMAEWSLYANNLENFLKHEIKFNKLKKELKDQQIKIRDVNEDAVEFYQGMPTKKYYDDQIQGRKPNFASAADNLRVEVLEKEGGVYFDILDIFPAKPLGDLRASLGFLCHLPQGLSSGRVNNDVIGSIAHGTLIRGYRNKIAAQQGKLYQVEDKVRAHRDSSYRTADRVEGRDYRLSSTLSVSGPNALSLFLNSMKNNLIPEADNAQFGWESIEFPSHFFQPDESQALSWVEKTNVEEILRNYFYQYLAHQIELLIPTIEMKTNQLFHANVNKLKKLEVLKHIISSTFPPLTESTTKAILIKFEMFDNKMAEMKESNWLDAKIFQKIMNDFLEYANFLENNFLPFLKNQNNRQAFIMNVLPELGRKFKEMFDDFYLSKSQNYAGVLDKHFDTHFTEPPDIKDERKLGP